MYHFPGQLYYVDPVNIARVQRWVTWMAERWSKPRLRGTLGFRVGGELGNSDLLGLSVGDAVRSTVAGMSGDLFIEGLHLTWVRERDSIGLEWNVADATPYSVRE